MQPLFIVSATRYSGAGAVAEHCCRALHEVSVDAQLLYAAGDNLEERLQDSPWAHAALAKERSPVDLVRTVRTIRRFAANASIVITHLQHDHTMTVLAGVAKNTPVVRSFRNPSHFRSDAWHRWLARPIAGALLAHSQMRASLDHHRERLPHLVFPVPLEDRFNTNADGSIWREQLAIRADSPVIGMVGKLAAGRGFDLLIDAVAYLEPRTHVVVVGHGEAQPELERLAAACGVGSRIHWTGYRERELPELYAAMDIVLYPAVGSDHGHRAISEAQACGKPVVATDLAGVSNLIEHEVSGLIVERSAPDLADGVQRLLASAELTGAITRHGLDAVRSRRFDVVGKQLAEFLESV